MIMATRHTTPIGTPMLRSSFVPGFRKEDGEAGGGSVELEGEGHGTMVSPSPAKFPDTSFADPTLSA